MVLRGDEAERPPSCQAPCSRIPLSYQPQCVLHAVLPAVWQTV